MATAALKAQIEQLRSRVEARKKARSSQAGGPGSPLDRIRADPAHVLTVAGLQPDPWQTDFLRSQASRTLLLTTRQAGKSTSAAARGIGKALTTPGSLVLLLSPSERQSGELATKVFNFYDALGQPVPARKRTELQLHLVNGSRIIALPESERTVRGYSGAALLVVDEASRVSDDLYRAVRPMLAVSRGQLVCMSTPFGKRGWFWEAWHSPDAWERTKITAEQCPRISPEFLAEERRSLGARWYRQEYLCSFEDVVDALFAEADIKAALSTKAEPLPWNAV
jgi:hypothetical protein